LRFRNSLLSTASCVQLQLARLFYEFRLPRLNLWGDEYLKLILVNRKFQWD
jgi:hypothetical protein